MTVENYVMKHDEDCDNYDKYEKEYVDLPDMSPLESDEKKNIRKRGIKNFNSKNVFHQTYYVISTNKFI